MSSCYREQTSSSFHVLRPIVDSVSLNPEPAQTFFPQVVSAGVSLQ